MTGSAHRSGRLDILEYVRREGALLASIATQVDRIDAQINRIDARLDHIDARPTGSGKKLTVCMPRSRA
jgi:hypothetical protein